MRLWRSADSSCTAAEAMGVCVWLGGRVSKGFAQVLGLAGCRASCLSIPSQVLKEATWRKVGGVQST
jgi:hypothetical protein